MQDKCLTLGKKVIRSAIYCRPNAIGVGLNDATCVLWAHNVLSWLRLHINILGLAERSSFIQLILKHKNMETFLVIGETLDFIRAQEYVRHVSRSNFHACLLLW